MRVNQQFWFALGQDKNLWRGKEGGIQIARRLPSFRQVNDNRQAKEGNKTAGAERRSPIGHKSINKE